MEWDDEAKGGGEREGASRGEPECLPLVCESMAEAASGYECKVSNLMVRGDGGKVKEVSLLQARLEFRKDAKQEEQMQSRFELDIVEKRNRLV